MSAEIARGVQSSDILVIPHPKELKDPESDSFIPVLMTWQQNWGYKKANYYAGFVDVKNRRESAVDLLC